MKQTEDRERALVARMRCPECAGTLAYEEGEPDGPPWARCRACDTAYPRVAGVWRMLTPTQRRQYAPFIGGYQELRAREGWARPRAYYLRLPQIKASDPAAAMWRIRRRSFRRLLGVVAPGRGAWALDLGAGNGWLARHLTRRGYQTVALDLNAAGSEGLEGGQLYLDHDSIWFGRIHGDMARLPFAAATFALCTISGALYYADLQATVGAVARVLAPGGLLLITDSPVYTQAAAGRRMADEQRARARAYLGHEPPALPGGPGFLLEPRVRAALAAAGFQVRLLPIERLLGRVRRGLRRVLAPGRREEARFPVIVARKAAPRRP